MAEIGRGGIGRVLIARDSHLGRDVALKELLVPESASSSVTTADGRVELSDASLGTARFLREAQVTGQLEHPGIVPVYELGARADGTLYYTMKLVRGRTLAQALRGCRSLDERLRLLPHFANLCHAVAYAHSRGVIHRDIKPANVMLGEFGETVVLDWGLAKVRGRVDIRDQALGAERRAAAQRHGRAHRPGHRGGHAPVHEPRAGHGGRRPDRRAVRRLGARRRALPDPHRRAAVRRRHRRSR